MERCPACHAPYTGKNRCHRCKLDLSTLLQIETRALEHLNSAKTELDSENMEKAFYHARRSCSLKKSPEAMGILMISAILTRRFDEAFSIRARSVL